MELFVLRAMMESARGEPVIANDLVRSAKLSASPRVGPNRYAITSNASDQSVAGDAFLLEWSGDYQTAGAL